MHANLQKTNEINTHLIDCDSDGTNIKIYRMKCIISTNPLSDNCSQANIMYDCLTHTAIQHKKHTLMIHHYWQNESKSNSTRMHNKLKTIKSMIKDKSLNLKIYKIGETRILTHRLTPVSSSRQFIFCICKSI